MDIKEYTERIYEIEQTHNMNQYLFNGIELWPLFRYHLLLQFRNKETYFKHKHERKQITFFDRCFAALKNSIRSRKVKGSIDKLVQSDVFMFDNEEKNISLNNNSYNIFLDPYLEYFGEEAELKASKFQLAWKSKVAKNNTQYAHKPIYLWEEDLIGFFAHNAKLSEKSVNELNSLFSTIESITNFKISFSRVLKDVERIIYCSLLFCEVLKKISPKFIYFQCYYRAENFGLILAAKKLGIKTIDIQHGKQGTHHPMYSHWSKIPEKGYKLLPDNFWTWGKESSHNMMKDRNVNSHLHLPIVGGNLWMMKWKNENFYNGTIEEIQFLQTLEQYDKVILFSLQPQIAGAVFPEFILNAIKQSKDKNWFWLLRKHPTQKPINDVEKKLNGVENYDYKYSEKLPLYLLLKKVNKHITFWSSVCFEAQEFGASTLIVHPIGKKLYENYINDSIFSYAQTANEVLKFIDEEKLVKNLDYIVSDFSQAKSAFQQLNM